MSAPRKLQGGSQSELTRLKALWRGWSDAEREAWRSLFASDTKQADIRQQLSAEVGIRLKFDSQLNSFRKWMTEQDARDAEAERQQIEEAQLRERHPDWDAEKLRTEVIAASYRRVLATGDFELGLKAVSVDQKERSQAFEETKFKEALKSKLESGLDALAEAVKHNAEAMKLYAQIRELIARETK